MRKTVPTCVPRTRSRTIAPRQHFLLLGLSILLCSNGCKHHEPEAPNFDAIIDAEDTRQVAAPALLDAAASGDARLRARAALAYGRIAKAPGLGPLFALLGDPSKEVRGMAAFSLGQFGWFDTRLGHEAEISARLLPLLGDAQADVRNRAIVAIGKLASSIDATRIATPLLHDGDFGVRSAAVMALFRSRQLARMRTPSAVPPMIPLETFSALFRLAADAHVEVRRAVSYYFSRNTDARAQDLLQKLFQDEDPIVRLYAVSGLRRIPNDHVIELLQSATHDAEYTVRVAAVQALGALDQADKLFKELRSDSIFHVRAALAAAYGATDKVDDQELLSMWQSDASVTVRIAALSALANRRKALVAPLLRMALDDSHFEIRAAAVSNAAVLGVSTQEAQSLLQRGLQDASESVRVAALEQLTEISDAWAYKAIQKAQEAAGLAERGTAAGLLSLRSEPERVALAWQSYQNSASHRWRGVRMSLLDVFAGAKDNDSIDHLRAAADDSEREVAAYARQLLQDQGIPINTELPAEAYVYSPFRQMRFAQNPQVEVKTSRGNFVIECFAADAPIHVASFVGLVQKGAYDGLLWHRVVSNFVIQGGDPEGSGWGDAGYSLRAEINEQPYQRGTLGMPRDADFDTGGSQLFFTHIPTPHLDGQYTVFGQIRSGLEVVDQIEQGDQILSAHVIE